MQDTSRQNDLITAKITSLKTVKDSPFRWYNGNVTTLLHSLKEGSDGYGGVSANFYPWMHAWLCANWDKEPEKATKVQRFLTVAEMVVKTKYPASAKVRSPYPKAKHAEHPALTRDPREQIHKKKLCDVTRDRGDGNRRCACVCVCVCARARACEHMCAREQARIRSC